MVTAITAQTAYNIAEQRRKDFNINSIDSIYDAIEFAANNGDVRIKKYLLTKDIRAIIEHLKKNGFTCYVCQEFNRKSCVEISWEMRSFKQRLDDAVNQAINDIGDRHETQ